MLWLVELQEVPLEGPVPFWWMWLLIAVIFVGVIAYLVGHLGPPGGPWVRP